MLFSGEQNYPRLPLNQVSSKREREVIAEGKSSFDAVAGKIFTIARRGKAGSAVRDLGRTDNTPDSNSQCKYEQIKYTVRLAQCRLEALICRFNIE